MPIILRPSFGVSRHQREVDRYVQWLDGTPGKAPENATKKDLLDYLAHLKTARGLSNTTQNQVLQTIRNYHEWLSIHRGIPDITAFIKIRGIYGQRLSPVLAPDELESLCDSYYHHTRSYIPSQKELRFYPDHPRLLSGRYIALTLVAYQGLQLHEIENLTPDGIDLRKGTVTVPASRMGAERKLPLDPSQVGAMMLFFAGGETPFVPNANQFERLNKTLKTLHPKYKDFTQLRASRITEWIRVYGLRKAQYLAGHRNISSTEEYVARDIDSLREDMAVFHPLG